MKFEGKGVEESIHTYIPQGHFLLLLSSYFSLSFIVSFSFSFLPSFHQTFFYGPEAAGLIPEFVVVDVDVAMVVVVVVVCFVLFCFVMYMTPRMIEN